jgi:hypothetical protein
MEGQTGDLKNPSLKAAVECSDRHAWEQLMPLMPPTGVRQVLVERERAEEHHGPAAWVEGEAGDLEEG